MASISFDARQLSLLARDFRRVAPKTYQASQRAVRAVAVEIEVDAARRSSFSKRISSSGKVRMMGLNATITFGGGNAWIAVPIENRGEGHVTHPTFGHDPKTNKNSHPAFLEPAFDEQAARVDQVLADAVIDATTIVLGAR